ncbi:PVC-type heme-binding CxxCH protein [Singulisphaera sp. PoT]|uniref:PVC-type heme-binding CxxCH protein n=1 Tax=Singulisphaera sp. PoT TaxID=3411797 RepID=UPI003BF48347
MTTLQWPTRGLRLAVFVAMLLGTRAGAVPPAGQDDMPALRVPPGLEVGKFAADPQLANPVAFCLDEQGRVYVAEEYRFNRGTEENRSRPFLLEDDLQIQTVDDRLAMYRKYADRFEGGMSWFSKYADQVRMVEDRDGDGKADVSTVFAGDFNGPLDGLAAGVIARDGDVYFTNIPNLWKLRDEDGDGKADTRKVLLHGFGVNAGFLGHDLHGLAWGPDGKLYFSVGDRGFHVTSQEGKTLHGPRSGAVFRCNPDGSEFEVVARGMRNPQELAFDAFGNLFAVDNNCDKGDSSRLVWVVEGGESGWNMAYQTISEPYLTGPWHAEKLWHLPHAGQAAWLLPPVGHIGAGPSGFAAYPGVGLPDKFRDHFFYCNFTGNGGVESFAVKRKGAGFEMLDMQPFLTPLLATDVDFGYDGKMYVSEFGRLEWDGSNKAGRIYTVADPTRRDDPTIRQVQALFKAGFRQRPIEELGTFLSHVDARVRQRAQFALAERGEAALPILSKLVSPANPPMARLHAVWGLGQIGRKSPEALASVANLLGDPDATLRGQAAKVIGQARYAKAGEALVGLLKAQEPSVRFEALNALGKIGLRAGIEPVVAQVRGESSGDPYLRHAAVMALLGINDAEAIRTLAKDADPKVRLVAVLVLRRLADPAIAASLHDADPSIVLEAARAINDLPIEAGTAELAKLLESEDFARSEGSEPLLRRAMNASFRLGGEPQIRALLAVVADARRPLAMREEALAALADWEKPSQRDRVNGFWRPIGSRDSKGVRLALESTLPKLLETTSGPLQAGVIDLATRFKAETDVAPFLARVADSKGDAAIRLASLRLLAGRKAKGLDEALQQALGAQDETLRAEARRIFATLDPDKAVPLIEAVLKDTQAPVRERQLGLATLATMKHPKADALLLAWLGRLAKGEAPATLQLDLIEAAEARGGNELTAAIESYRKGRSESDPLAAYRPSLEGGDAEKGRALFVGHQQGQCIRCHRVVDRGGSAGPDLTKVATRGDREFFLQSMVDPDAKIAPDFGTVLIALTDGRVVNGVLKSETKTELVIETAGGIKVNVPVDQIDERSAPRSAMPKMTTALSPREMRDLVEFLSTLK